MKGVWFVGSTGEIAMPCTPRVRRSSIIRFCSAAVGSAAILNSADTSASSLSAFSTPFRAIVQKSELLLVTKASFNSLGASALSTLGAELHEHRNRSTQTDEARIGSLLMKRF